LILWGANVNFVRKQLKRGLCIAINALIRRDSARFAALKLWTPSSIDKLTFERSKKIMIFFIFINNSN